jgi:hypothetical protein
MTWRSWIKDPFSLLFKRRKIPRDVRELIDAIVIIDAARAGRFKRLRELGKYVSDGDLAKATGFSWKAVRGDISTVLNLPSKEPAIARFASLIPLLSMLIIVGFLSIVVMFGAKIYNIYSQFDLPNTVAIALFLVGGLLVARWYMEQRIMEFYESNPTKSQSLKRFNQALIDYLIQKLEHSKSHVDFQMRLLNKDYRGIAIQKERGLFRDFYVAKVETSRG